MQELPLTYSSIDVLLNQRQKKFKTRQDLANIIKEHISGFEFLYKMLGLPDIIEDKKKLYKCLEIVESQKDFVMYNGFLEGDAPFIPKHHKFVFKDNDYEIINLIGRTTKTKIV